MKKIAVLIILLISSTVFFGQNSTNETLEKIITKVADTVTGDMGRWQFAINDRMLICITDENNNRMRIMSPITELENLTEKEILNALVANFHTALDVKYAVSDEIIWSVFIHPLKELQEPQIEDAIKQVYSAAATFGSIYSSTNLSFPGNTQKVEKESTSPKQLKLQKG